MKRFAMPLLALLVAAGAVAWLLSGTPAQPTPDSPPAAPDVPDARHDPDLVQGAERPAANEDPTAARPNPVLADRLHGRVEQTDGTPIRGATVRAALVDPQRLRGAPFDDAPPFGQTTSDANGAFAMDAPPKRYVTVTASAPGFATQSVRVASRAAFAHIRLSRAGALRVHVVDTADQPIATAAVHVAVAGTEHRAETDVKGIAVFDALAPGSAVVRAWVGAAGPRVRGPALRIAVGETATTWFVLPPVVFVQGIVVDEDGDVPIANASVLVSQPGVSVNAGTTDARGRFAPVAAGGPGERQFLSVEADGYAPALEPVVLRRSEPGQAQSVVVRLRRAEPWRGRVLGPQGAPVAGARVAFAADGVAQRPPVETRSDEGGWFTLPPPRPPVPGRRLVLGAHAPGGHAALVVRAGEGPPAPLVLQLAADAGVFGRVRDRSGAPLAGAQVRLLPVFDRARRAGRMEPSQARRALANETGFAQWATATGEDGSWRVDRVAPGAYRVQVRAGAHVVWMPDTVDVEDVDVNTGVFNLSAGSGLTGVVRARDGTPLAGTTVRLIADTKDFRPATVRTGEDGAYAFEDVPAGTYRVDALLHGFHLIEPESVQLGDVDHHLDLTLDPGAQLTVRILDGQGQPWTGTAQVRLQRPGRARPSQAPHALRVGKNGATLSGLRPGTYDVEARVDGWIARSAAPIDLGLGRAAEVTLSFERTSVLRGRVVTQKGAASAGARVHLQDLASGLRLLATTDAEGAFALQRMRPGTYDVRAHGPGGAPTTDQVTVSAGDTTDLKLLLGPSGAVDIHVLGPDGRAVRHARLTFRTGSSLVRGMRPVRTGADGRVRRDDLPVGHLTVHARDDDGRRGVAEVEVARDQVQRVVVRLTAAPD